MQYLSNASKIMMLNEFEISAWGVWLDEYKLEGDHDYTVEDFIYHTAFYLKMQLNDEDYLEDMFVSYFNCYINEFILKFNGWLKDNRHQFVFDPVKVNKKYKQLNAPYNPQRDEEFVDYNNCVDDILNISPAYQTHSKYTPTCNSQINSQASIIPKRKKVKTIPFGASPHQIDWSRDKRPNPLASLKASNSQNINLEKGNSTISVKNIHSRSQKSHLSQGSNINDEIMKKSFEFANMFSSSLNRLYNLKDVKHNPADFNPDSLFGSNITPVANSFLQEKNNNKAVNKGVKGSNLNFKNSLSRMSSNSFDPLNFKSRKTPGLFQNPSMQNATQSMPKDLVNEDGNRYRNDEVEEEGSVGSSQNNSLTALFKNDQTPALFRGTAGGLDAKGLIRKK